MITEETFEFYNNRLTADLIPNKKLTPSQRDAIKTYGSQAEALLKNRDLAQFIHHFKFSINDTIANIRTHTPDANAERVALANQLSGIDSFVNTLKSAVYKRTVLLRAEATENISTEQ